MFVITGPTFTRESERIGPHGVKAPNYLYKLVYHTTTGPAWTHWQANRDKAQRLRPAAYRPKFCSTDFNKERTLQCTAENNPSANRPLAQGARKATGGPLSSRSAFSPFLQRQFLQSVDCSFCFFLSRSSISLT